MSVSVVGPVPLGRARYRTSAPDTLDLGRALRPGDDSRLVSHPNEHQEANVMEATAIRLTPDQKAHFDTLGYLFVPQALTEREVAQFTQVFMDVYRREWGQEEFDPKFA